MKEWVSFNLSVDQLLMLAFCPFALSVLIGVEGFLSAIQEQAKKDKK